MWMRDITKSAEAIMMDWIAQALLDSAGFIVSCFIARETPQFAVMQGSLALVLLVSLVALVAFWPAHWTIPLSSSTTKAKMD
jgi:uncharacterized membrane protein (DUF485 family)